MRTSLVVASAILLAGCAGTVYVPPSGTVATAPRQPAPKPVVLTPAPRTTPVIMPPVGVTIVRVDDSRLQVSTNQPAYLTVFEIVPGRGAALVYPQSPRERPAPLVGSSWLSVAWPSARYADARYSANDRGMGRGDPRRRDDRIYRRYIYAIATERPLRLPERAFDGDRLRDLLDVRVARADDPYETMSALSRRFVPMQMDDADWGEDSYTIEMVDTRMPIRVVAVTCRDGSVTYVREDRADRDWCASRGGRGPNRGGTTAPHADPVIGNRPTDTHGVTRGGERIYRLPEPEVVQAGAPANGGRGSNGDADIRQGRGNWPTYDPPRRTGDADIRQGRGNSPTDEPSHRTGDADLRQGGRDSSTTTPTRGAGDADFGQGRGNNGHHYGRDAGSDTLKRNGNTHGNDQQNQNGNGQGNGQQGQNRNDQGNGQQSQNRNDQGNAQQSQNGNGHGNGQQAQNGNGQQKQNGNSQADDQQKQNGNPQQQPVGRQVWAQPANVQPLLRTAPAAGAGEPRPVAEPPVVRASTPEVKPAPAAEPTPSAAPAADQPRHPAKDPAPESPERRRPNMKARPDSSSDKPAGDDKPTKQI